MRKKFLLCFALFSMVCFSETLNIHLGSQIRGIDPDFEALVIKAIEESGHNPVVLPDIPALRAEKKLEDKELDIYFKIPEHSKKQDLAIPIKVTLLALRIRAFANSSIGAKTLSDLEGKTFATVPGLSINDVVASKIPNIVLHDKLVDFSKVLMFVAKGRGDFLSSRLK